MNRWQALIADLTPQDRRIKAFGLRYTAINIGATLGPLIGAYLAFLSANLAFFITAVVYLLYALALSYLMAKISFESDGDKREQVTFRSTLNVMRRDVPLRYYLLGGILVNLGYSQVNSTLPQHVEMTITDGVTLYSVLLSFNAIVCRRIRVADDRRTLAVRPVRCRGDQFGALLCGRAETISGSEDGCQGCPDCLENEKRDRHGRDSQHLLCRA